MKHRAWQSRMQLMFMSLHIAFNSHSIWCNYTENVSLRNLWQDKTFWNGWTWKCRHVYGRIGPCLPVRSDMLPNVRSLLLCGSQDIGGNNVSWCLNYATVLEGLRKMGGSREPTSSLIHNAVHLLIKHAAARLGWVPLFRGLLRRLSWW